MDKIRVFLSDWQVLFREGIHFTLSGEDDFEVTGEATSNAEVLASIEKNPPNVAIFNANLGKPGGIEITRRIKQNLPSVAVILVMDNYDDEKLFAAMKCGASACLTKDMDPEELVDVIRKVASGNYPVREALCKPEIASRVLNEFQACSSISQEVGNLLAGLTPAENEILRRVIDGSSSKEITKAVNISDEAFKNNLGVMLDKMVSNDRGRELIEAAQSNLSTIITKISRGEPGKTGRPAAEYITRDEFDRFRETIIERLKSFLGELK